MVIHFSVLGLILVVSLFWEHSVRTRKVNSLLSGQGYGRKSALLPWLIILGYVTFLAALRSHVNDTGAYVHSFNNLEASWEAFREQIASAKEENDWAFDAVGILFKMFISEDYHWWFFAFAAVETMAMIHVLRKYAVSLLDSCYFFFCGSLYFNYFSMMRQWFAVVMIFAAIDLLKEKRFISYLIVCVILAQFHASAYLMIPLYFFVQGKAWSGKQVAIITVFCAAMFFLNPLLSTLETTLEGTTYDYVVESMSEGNGSSPIRILISAVPVVLAFADRKWIDDKLMNICVNMALINFLLTVLATLTSGLFVVRFTVYTNIYNLLLYPYLLDVVVTPNNRKILKPAFYILYVFLYFYDMSKTGSFYYASDILGTFQ